MAERQVTFQFKSVQLFKDQSLGIGSYGAVCRAKCDDLLCAAKIIHPTLFDPTAVHRIAPQREHRLPIRRFEQECDFMSAIRHPNIVQYLGMFRDTDTCLPVLLMELMDDSLTHFLENSTQPIPYHIQVNICHDVTLALSFLHSNEIIHRDLSSNNILLIGNVRAKVTDFGMARLGDINPQASCFTITVGPGTDVYMPPEAVQDKPGSGYTEKIDCFSFGVIIVQIVTRQFPKPGGRLQRVELNHPVLPTGSVLVEVPEISRRQNHISQIAPNHSLLPVALDCLKDKDSERPSAHQLCERVAGLKRMPDYIESARNIQDMEADEIIQAQANRIQEKEYIISSKEEEIRQLRQLQQEKEIHVGRLNQQLENSEQLVAQFERRIAELEQQLSQREKQNSSKASSRGKELTNFKLKWKKGKRAPCEIERWYDAVVDGNTVYVRREETVEIYSYDVSSESWSQLPNCVNGHSSIAVINDWLTTIGGWCPSAYSDELFSLTGEDNSKRWTRKFPPMPTKRQCATAQCIGTTLIVIGGWGIGGVLSTVEVMNTKTHQWSTAADLPEPLYNASATCIMYEDQLYLLGGLNKDYTPAKSVYTCSMSTLLQSCISNSVEEMSKGTSLEDKASVWRQLADLPVTRSTCQSLHNQLLAVGGKTDPKKSSKARATTDVYMYHSATDSWKITSHMTTGRHGCFTAVFSNNQMMVVGGCISEGKMTDSIEFASVHVC